MSDDVGLDIGVIGLSTVDCAASIGRYNRGTMNPINDLRVTCGGLGNAVAALSGLGLEVGVCTRVGKDVFGDFLLNRWKESGIDTSAVTIDSTRSTAISFIACEDGERTPFYSAGANEAFCLADIPESWLAGCKCLLVFFAGALPSLDGEPMLQLLEKCRELGVPVILDTIDSVGTNYEWLWSYLPLANIVLNLEEGKRVSGKTDSLEALRVLTESEHRVDGQSGFAAITRSDGVSFSLFDNARWTDCDVPSPFAKLPVRDVVGAGDAFRAGLAAYICLNNKSRSIGTMDANEACTFAAAMAYSYLNREKDMHPFSRQDLENLIRGSHHREDA